MSAGPEPEESIMGHGSDDRDDNRWRDERNGGERGGGWRGESRGGSGRDDDRGFFDRADGDAHCRGPSTAGIEMIWIILAP